MQKVVRDNSLLWSLYLGRGNSNQPGGGEHLAESFQKLPCKNSPNEPLLVYGEAAGGALFLGEKSVTPGEGDGRFYGHVGVNAVRFCNGC